MYKKRKLILFFFLFSFVILLFASKFSFLYAFNDWQDANSFLTVARSILNGKILYKDIIEQKGPLLYFIYCLGYLFNFKQINGIFILEIINLTIIMYFSNLILEMYKKTPINKYMSIIFGLIICTSASFTHGGSAEEFCLSFLIIALYYFNKNFVVNFLTKKEFFLVGVITTCIFFIKLNLIFLPFFSIICICIEEFFKKNYKNILNVLIYFSLGVFFLSLIFIIYFVINDNFNDFLYCYFIINGKFYIDNNFGILYRMYIAYQLSIKNLSVNVMSLYLFILYSLFVFKGNKKLKLRLYTVLIYIFMSIGIYMGVKYYIYYALPLFVIFIYSFVFAIQFIYEKKIIGIIEDKKLVLRVIFFLLVPLLSYNFANYKNYLFLRKEDFAQYRISNKILKYKESPVVLNYGELDYGFYNILNVVPDCKYFHRMNIPYEKMKENYSFQKEYIDKGNVDFVIVGIKSNKEEKSKKELISDLEWINEKYDLIYCDKQYYESDIINFYVFMVNDKYKQT